MDLVPFWSGQFFARLLRLVAALVGVMTVMCPALARLSDACLTSRGEDTQKRIDQSEESSEQDTGPIKSFGQRKRLNQSEAVSERSLWPIRSFGRRKRLDQSEAVSE